MIFFFFIYILALNYHCGTVHYNGIRTHFSSACIISSLTFDQFKCFLDVIAHIIAGMDTRHHYKKTSQQPSWKVFNLNSARIVSTELHNLHHTVFILLPGAQFSFIIIEVIGSLEAQLGWGVW